ncbi:MAG TPA: 30S ribosomal protein S1 [Candidatus Dormibacteraeota bacterium]|nr:30S ribosomal protein S1 [Candidatus Dormibacteraeota bacterium]
MTQSTSESQLEGVLTMQDYLDLDDQNIRQLSHGDIVDGVVVRVDPDEVLVDIGSKSEGVISNRELGMRGDPNAILLNEGDEIKVYVLSPENEDGNVVLSLRRAKAEGIWTQAAEREQAGEVVEAEVREQNKGGLIVNVLGLRGFLPTSQVSRQFANAPEELLTQKIQVKILEVNRKRNRLIVSQKAAMDEDRARQREELFEKLQVGDVVKGRVSGLTTYGAFVNLGGADGLIHISELSWDRVNSVNEVLSVGDEVEVKVIKLDHELSRISLSLRQMSEDPWETIEQRFPSGSIVKGEVTKTKKYGAFLQLDDGIEGLLHISELTWEHVEKTEDVVSPGDKLEVQVLNADRVRRRISLSLKQLQERPQGVAYEEPARTDYADYGDDDEE